MTSWIHAMAHLIFNLIERGKDVLAVLLGHTNSIISYCHLECVLFVVMRPSYDAVDFSFNCDCSVFLELDSV